MRVHLTTQGGFFWETPFTCQLLGWVLAGSPLWSSRA